MRGNDKSICAMCFEKQEFHFDERAAPENMYSVKEIRVPTRILQEVHARNEHVLENQRVPDHGSNQHASAAEQRDL